MYLNLINIYHKNRQPFKVFLSIFYLIFISMLIFSMSNTILAGDFFIGLGLTSVTTLNLAPQQFIENVMEVINSEFLYTGWLFPLESKDDFLGVKLSFFSSFIFLYDNFYLQIFYLGLEGFYHHTIFETGIFSVNFNSGLWVGLQILPFLRNRENSDFFLKVAYDSVFPINAGYTLGMNLKIASLSICIDYYLSLIDILYNEDNDYKVINMIVISLKIFF